MEKKRYERKPLSLEAELAVGNENYSCVIQNLSEYGAYIEVATLMTVVEFYAETRVELKFQLLPDLWNL